MIEKIRGFEEPELVEAGAVTVFIPQLVLKAKWKARDIIKECTLTMEMVTVLLEEGFELMQDGTPRGAGDRFALARLYLRGARDLEYQYTGDCKASGGLYDKYFPDGNEPLSDEEKASDPLLRKAFGLDKSEGEQGK